MKKLVIGLMVVMLAGAGIDVATGQPPSPAPPPPPPPPNMSGILGGQKPFDLPEGIRIPKSSIPSDVPGVWMTFQADNLPDEYLDVLRRNWIYPSREEITVYLDEMLRVCLVCVGPVCVLCVE